MGRLQEKLTLEIDPTVQPVRLPVRRIPLAVKTELKKELDRLQKLSAIQREDKPTDWISSLMVVQKPNGKLRICIDPKPLNKALKRSHYLLSTLEDLLPELTQAKVFSDLDVRNGFWHIELDNESILLTTFAAPFGRYRWKRMPFGNFNKEGCKE